ncbi:MAG: GNAT family N-acetyltransferase [Nocardioides sp.]
MRDTSELVSLERECFVACYRALAEASPQGAVLDGPGTFAFVTKMPLPMFNGCVVTEPERAPGLDEALTWLVGSEVPFTLWVPAPVPAEIEAVAAQHGLTPEPDPLPGMVLSPVPSSPALPRGLVIERVDSSRTHDFARVVVSLGLGEESAERLTSPSFVDRADLDLFIGYLDGVPVSTSVAVSSAGAGAIVNVLTLEEARGQGIGTALTWAAARAGVARGHDTLALQASPMGLPVYLAMGFETVVEYVEYT